MDTQDSSWFAKNQAIAYPDFGIAKPDTPEQLPVAEQLGPITLSASGGNLAARWWAVWQDGVNVVISGANDLIYGTPVNVFVEADAIEQIALTFDQAGRPFIFYKLENTDLKLYWFDPVLQQNITSVIGQGNYPTAIFDYPTRPNESLTDAVIFYVGIDSQIKYRKQRDRFEVEYAVPNTFASIILSAGLSRENRVQVVYK